MGRKLMRVPMDFAWPLDKTWGGYLNPYATQATKCPDCNGSGQCARAMQMSDEWYGVGYNTGDRYVPFDAAKYGSKPLDIEHPILIERAQHNVNRAPEYYLTPHEKRVEAAQRKRITEEEGIVVLHPTRAAAYERERNRLYLLWSACWSHQLRQEDVDALVVERRLMDFTHRPLNPQQTAALVAQAAAGGSAYWLHEPNGYPHEQSWRGQLEAFARRALKLRAFHNARNAEFKIRLRTSAFSSGHAYGYSRFVVTAGTDRADAFATILHEIAHLIAGYVGGAHSDRWRAAFADGVHELTGRTPSGNGAHDIQAEATQCVADWLAAGGE